MTKITARKMSNCMKRKENMAETVEMELNTREKKILALNMTYEKKSASHKKFFMMIKNNI